CLPYLYSTACPLLCQIMMFCENFAIFCPLDATGGSDRRQSRGLALQAAALYCRFASAPGFRLAQKVPEGCSVGCGDHGEQQRVQKGSQPHMACFLKHLAGVNGRNPQEGREGEEQDSIQGYSRVARDTRGKQLTVMVEEPEGQTAGIEDHRHRYAPASAQSPGVGVEGHRVA